MRFESHCHLTGLLTADDVVAIAEDFPPPADLAVVGDGVGVLSLARQGAAALARRWVMRPCADGRATSLTGWQRFAAHAAVAARILCPSGLVTGSLAHRQRAWQQVQAVSATILQRQAARWQRQEVSRVDLRAHVAAVPPALQEHYVEHLLHTLRSLLATTGVHIQLRCSLPRRGWQAVVRNVLATVTSPQVRPFWAGWDWCGTEIMPEDAELFGELPAPVNAGRSIHAGEQLAVPRPLLDALFHCHAAVTMWGAQRLAHAVILGCDLQAASLVGRRWQWSAHALAGAQAWWQAQAPQLGLPLDSPKHAGLWSERGAYNASALAVLTTVQQAIIDDLRLRGTIIESCPTSNARIVAGTGFRHPLPGLLATGLPLLIGTDDSGLLATDLAKEQMRARQMGWS